MDFKGEKDPLEQNGLQGQYQYGLIVSKTCCNFLVEFVSSFFPLKWRVIGGQEDFHQIIDFLVSVTFKTFQAKIIIFVSAFNENDELDKGGGDVTAL